MLKEKGESLSLVRWEKARPEEEHRQRTKNQTSIWKFLEMWTVEMREPFKKLFNPKEP